MDNPLALIVEDDPDAAEIFSEAVRAAGFEPEIISEGNQALTRLDATKPALVVLDMHLPHVAGPTILRYIRASAKLNDVPVIIATADPSMADTLQEEATLVLLKPISFSQLRDLANRLR